MTKINNKISLILFLFVVTTYLVALWFRHHYLLLIFKPLIVTTLLFYFLNATAKRTAKLKSLMIFALIFCLFGDILLMFTRGNSLFFVLGLSAFLLGHIFYILVFKRIVRDNSIPFHLLKTFFVTAYAAFLLYLLIPSAGTLWLPVVLYGLVIGTMMVFAFHLTKLGETGWLIAVGAFLFVISDSFLALNKFYTFIPQNDWIVMITYIAAQFLIVKGMVKYISQAK